MGAILEVRVLPRADHSERSEAQLREGARAWGGSRCRTVSDVRGCEARRLGCSG